jgi:hypothetical protein
MKGVAISTKSEHIHFALKTWAKCCAGGWCVQFMKPFEDLKRLATYPEYMNWIEKIEEISADISGDSLRPWSTIETHNNCVILYWEGFFTEGRRMKIELDHYLVLKMYWDTATGAESSYLRLPSRVLNDMTWDEVHPGTTWIN